MIRVQHIHSGGQTGADQGALFAGRALGYATGGWAPKGWRTDTGPALWLDQYGLREHPSTSYPPRTRLNIEETDGTLVVGYAGSPGCRLTVAHAEKLDKPLHVVTWTSGDRLPDIQQRVDVFNWLSTNRIVKLNVAGNRESSQPGIEAVTAWLLMMVIPPLATVDPVKAMAQAPIFPWVEEPAVGVPTPAAVQAAGAPKFDVVTRQEDGSFVLADCQNACEVGLSAVHPPEYLPHLAAQWVLKRRGF